MAKVKYRKKDGVLEIPLKIGDIVLTGRFRNKPVKIKEISVDELGQPTINKNPILKFRMPSLMSE